MIDFYLKKKKNFTTYNDGKSKAWRRKKITDIRNLFSLKKELNYNTIKNRILRDIKNLFEREDEQENYYKSVRVSRFGGNNYIEYESNGDRN